MTASELKTRAETLTAQMSDAQKCRFVTGKDFWHLNGEDALGLPEILVTDGPHGLRKQSGKADHVGLNSSDPATCFPTASATACSFDRELMYEIGQALAEECIHQGVSVLLGPGVNHKRSPLCGRNFEYFSEDPLLSGELGAALVRGIQSLGVGTSVKHFAANSQEALRMVSDSIVDERALREIYLKQFEIIVKKAHPTTIMTAYNRLNGTYCSENSLLMEELARKDWGFDGVFVTDWGAMNEPVQSYLSGLDLEMPGHCKGAEEALLQVVNSGRFPREKLDGIAQRLMELILHTAQNCPQEYDAAAHLALAQRAAEESAVLLKNQDGILPLKKGARIALIGTFAKAPRYQGAGSSKVNPLSLDNAYDALIQLGVEPEFAPGYREDGSSDAALLEQAAELAARNDVAVVFAGLPASYESEGYDRTSLNMPQGHNDLISAVCRANPNTVVVLQCGGAVTMPWLCQAKGVLHTFLSGCQGGKAAAALLTGNANPCGKLAETYPLSPEDVPCREFYSGTGKICQYRESVYTGYRYYTSADVPVCFPFGFGLSYTQFDYSDLIPDRERLYPNETLNLQFTLHNRGTRPGKETVQLYLSHPDSPVFRPAEELREFCKISLAPGESREVSLALSFEDFAFFNVATHCWYVPPGIFEIRIGASSEDIRLSARVEILQPQLQPLPQYPAVYARPNRIPHLSQTDFEALLGQKLPEPSPVKKPFTLNTTFGELGEASLFFRMLMPLVKRVAASTAGGDPEQRNMAVQSVLQMPIRGAGMSGFFDRRGLDGLLDLINGHPIRGLKKLRRKKSA